MSKKKINTITPLQQDTLTAISQYVKDKGYPPTIKELGVMFTISHASAHDRVNQLVRKGYLKRNSGKSRGLTVVQKSKDIPVNYVSVPIVGHVAAGAPIFAEENLLGEVLVADSTIHSGKHFALRIKGDSMVNAGIKDGDLIIVRQQPIAEHGDIVVASLGGDATVKRLKINGDAIELIPENTAYEPIQVEQDDQLNILGKVVGWQHPRLQ